jgi:hypothetical protein
MRESFLTVVQAQGMEPGLFDVTHPKYNTVLA